MAIRFIDTNFFKSPYVRGLKAHLKTLYCFIICDCTGAGIWSKDLEVASLYIGVTISEKDWQNFIETGKAIDLKDGKFFFPDFIQHQYPKGLNENNPAQKNFILELNKYKLLDGSLKPLLRPLQGSTSIGNSKSNSKSNSIGKSEKRAKVKMPFDSQKFRDQWLIWKDYKKQELKFQYKTIQSEQAALKGLSELSENNEVTAIKILHQSMANGWKGFFELKKQNNGQDLSEYRKELNRRLSS